jgi:transposase
MLYSKDFKIHTAQGRKLRLFISSYGQKAISDKIDAKMIAIYGQKMQESLRLYKPNDTQLPELISWLQDIKDMLQKEFNRKEHFSDKSAKDSINTIINVLQKQLDSIEQEINKRINNNQKLKQKDEGSL